MFSAATKTAAAAAGGYQISRSLRFNSADSANLSRTFSTTGTNLKIRTLSLWIKRVNLGVSSSSIIQCYNGSSSYSNGLEFNSSDQLFFGFGGGSFTELITTAVYRDPSAWYHIVVAIDTTQATASNRVKLYVNGVQVTAFATANYPSQNADSQIGSANANNKIGSQWNNTGYVNAYMTEFYFIDGQALTPSDFGETNTQTGVWQPKAYSGSYGTNGFYLNFSDNSNTTAATLGKDYSGNGNNWTPNNFSVAAGVGNDSMVDTPTPYGVDTGAGGEVRGNYSTMNPLSTTAGTYTQGNLRYAATSSWRRSNATISRSDGKWYWEVTLGNAPLASRNSGSAWNAFGFGVATAFNSTTDPSAVTDAVILADNGWFKNFSGSWTDGGTAFSSGDVLSIAVDLDANTFTFRRNNTQITTGTIGGTAGRELVPIIISYNDSYGVMDCNFGQRPFAYTAPSGFKALCTQNLPTPTIGATTATQAGKYFDVVLRNGGGSSGGTYSTTVDMSSGALLWDKPRNSASSNYLVDSVRGISKNLRSNVTNAEATDASWFTNFGSSSFTTGSSDWGTGTTVVDWIWAANGSGSTNTAGSITSTVSANTTSGFSIVTYTGNGVSGATVGHGLGVTPSMIILKSRTDGVYDWRVYHSALTAGYNIALNSTAQQYQGSTGNAGFISAVSSTTYTLTQSGADVLAAVNKNGDNYVAYCFAAVPGFSAFGSYTGNGSTDGPFVFCGFRPRWIMYKDASATNPWVIVDTTRQNYNVLGPYLLANASDAENTFPILDALSNGFKVRFGGPSSVNTSGNTIVFAAFAQFPFKYALAL